MAENVSVPVPTETPNGGDSGGNNIFMKNGKPNWVVIGLTVGGVAGLIVFLTKKKSGDTQGVNGAGMPPYMFGIGNPNQDVSLSPNEQTELFQNVKSGQQSLTDQISGFQSWAQDAWMQQQKAFFDTLVSPDSGYGQTLANNFNNINTALTGFEKRQNQLMTDLFMNPNSGYAATMSRNQADMLKAMQKMYEDLLGRIDRLDVPIRKDPNDISYRQGG